jgi:hypothetical protein
MPGKFCLGELIFNYIRIMISKRYLSFNQQHTEPHKKKRKCLFPSLNGGCNWKKKDTQDIEICLIRKTGNENKINIFYDDIWMDFYFFLKKNKRYERNISSLSIFVYLDLITKSLYILNKKEIIAKFLIPRRVHWLNFFILVETIIHAFFLNSLFK